MRSARPGRDAGAGLRRSTSNSAPSSAQVLRGGQRVVPRRALDLGYEFRFTGLDEALRGPALGGTAGTSPNPQPLRGGSRVRRSAYRPSQLESRGGFVDRRGSGAVAHRPSPSRQRLSLWRSGLGGFVEDRAGEARSPGPGASEVGDRGRVLGRPPRVGADASRGRACRRPRPASAGRRREPGPRRPRPLLAPAPPSLPRTAARPRKR